MNRHVLLLPLLASASLAGCSEPAQDAWAGTVSDSAGVTVVSNPAEGVWGSTTPWTLVEELRVGTMEGDPNLQFGQIGARGIGKLSDGRLLVLDAMGQHVKVFSPEGEFLTTIGGPGSGPGEIGPGNNFLLVAAGDTILVPDLQNQRTNLYAADGESLGSFPMDMTKGIPFLWLSTADGRIAAQIRPLDLPDLPESDGMDRIFELAAGGTVLDTVLSFPSGGTFAFGGDSPEIKLFAPEPTWSLTPGMGVLYGVTDQYRIHQYSPDGQLESVVTKPFASPPVEPSDQRVIMDVVERAWAEAGVPEQALPQLRSMVQFAESYPAFARIEYGPDGTIWVQRIQPVSQMSAEALAAYDILEDAGSPDWEIFDAEGRFLGTLTMPARFVPRLFDGDRILGVGRDELDVQYLVSMRVDMGGE